jgi:hypothetical protein
MNPKITDLYKDGKIVTLALTCGNIDLYLTFDTLEDYQSFIKEASKKPANLNAPRRR